MISYIVKELIAARRFGYLFQMASHKFLRWWLGPLLLVTFVTNLALIHYATFYAVLATLQVVALGLAIFAVVMEASRVKIPGVSSLAFLLVGSAGMCMGMLRFLFRGGMKTWEPIR
jgi:hypothetical protein